MAPRFPILLKNLKTLYTKLDLQSQQKLEECLSQLRQCKLPNNQSLAEYHEYLLFLCAYPSGNNHLLLAEKELSRITRELKKRRNKSSKSLLNSGLPFTPFISNFSHDCLCWLGELSECRLEISNEAHSNLNELFQHTLPSMERSYTTAGYSNKELLDTLGVKTTQLLNFYVSQFKNLNHSPSIKDYLFDQLGLEVKIIPTDKTFSRTYNRLTIDKIYFQENWSKHFDVVELLNRNLPEPKSLNSLQRKELITCIKKAMALNDRETDPTTYLDAASLRLYELERGISVAIYGMIASRQLPMESYVGYTLFKNGFPVSYGGSWVFGERANFGINIFESFRGAESGYTFCQLLRVFKNTFGVLFFEVEPYQFGLGNPEGITSGAFWFYYHYGFRPMDKALKKLAAFEKAKINKNKSYRTRKSILQQFTESSMVLKLSKKIPLSLPSVTNKITSMIETQFGGDRDVAINECTRLFEGQTKIRHPLNQDQQNILYEVALVSKALRITNSESLALLAKMIDTKPIDLYGYQQLLLTFLKKVNN